MEKRIYFKNLNALRFFAALLVIFHHIEQYKLWANVPNLCGNVTIDALGHKAVSFFFVLSGFLITYLLLTENRQSGNIDVKSFYVRRILRIWPLYYLIVVLCLFVLPNILDLTQLNIHLNDNFITIAGLLFLFLPNVVRLFAPHVAGGNQLWSIGVEEQFYLMWPLLVKWFMKHLLVFLLAFIGLKLAVTFAFESILNTFASPPVIFKAALRFWVLLQIEQMAIGAIGAWVLFQSKERILSIIYNKLVWWSSLVCLIGLFVIPLDHWIVNYFEAAVFVVVIMNLSTNPAIKLSMENKLLTTLGNISYGVYMYHTICITLCLYALRNMRIQNLDYTLFNILLYTFSVCLTIGLSYLSYEFFEKRFLALKEKFMVVKSGKNTAAETQGEGALIPPVLPQVRKRTTAN